MDLWSFLIELVMLLGCAFLLGALAQRLRQSPILGYLLAGTIVGPLLFNTSAVNQAAELGVSLLLFSIGLEFSFHQLRKMGKMAFGGGTAQIVITILIATIALKTFLPLSKALTIGAIVALSSTTMVLRLLSDRSEVDSVRGRSCLGILLMQDIAIVPLVVMVSLLAPAAPDTSLVMHIIKIVAAVVGLAIIFYLLLYYVAPVLLFSKGLFANRELTVLLAISVGIGSTWAAHAANISPALGAFVAGMLLGESPFATQIRSDIGTLRIIMVTVFFASVGMLAKPVWFFMHLHWVLLAAIIIFIVKAVIIYGVTRLVGLTNRQAIATGITISQIGDFSFVLAATARSSGVLDGNTSDFIVSVIIVLMFATPFMVAFADPLADRLLSFFSREKASSPTNIQNGHQESIPMVMVVGLGPAGRQVVNMLKEKKLEPVAVEVNPLSRQYAKEQGIRLYLGDAGHEEVLMHAGLMDVCMAVVTIPDPATSVHIVKLIRRLKPGLNIAVRCRFNRYLDTLKHAGADMVVDEETTMGQMLSQMILKSIEETSGSAMACRISGQVSDVQA